MIPDYSYNDQCMQNSISGAARLEHWRERERASAFNKVAEGRDGLLASGALPREQLAWRARQGGK